MRQAWHNPPCDSCPECVVPSKVWVVGAATKDGMREEDWCCEVGHRWTLREPSKSIS